MIRLYLRFIAPQWTSWTIAGSGRHYIGKELMYTPKFCHKWWKDLKLVCLPAYWTWEYNSYAL